MYALNLAVIKLQLNEIQDYKVHLICKLHVNVGKSFSIDFGFCVDGSYYCGTIFGVVKYIGNSIKDDINDLKMNSVMNKINE